MNRDEKNHLTKEKIVNAALKEFSESNYFNVSVDSICKSASISKGIIYHYFKSKDELYLYCVKICINSLCRHLLDNSTNHIDAESSFNNYMNIRNDFFTNNQNYRNIFFEAILRSPNHLKDSINDIKQKLNKINMDYYCNLVNALELRDNITKEDALDYFMMLEGSFNSYFQLKKYESFDELIKEHEIILKKMINSMLFGIVIRR